jgi:hypothetical protein
VSAEGGVTWRYERKWVVRDADPRWALHAVRLHPAHFREIYHERFVNNCYFDTLDHRMLRDSVQGHGERLKVRIRWYGDLFGVVERPVLELKRKHATVGTKASFPVPPFCFDRTSPLPLLRGWFGAQPWPAGAPGELADFHPVLINRYRRRYFATPDGKVRLTIDTGCEYYAATPGRLRSRPQPRDAVTSILELKSDRDDEDIAREVADRIPFRLTKSSKYVNGMLRVGIR